MGWDPRYVSTLSYSDRKAIVEYIQRRDIEEKRWDMVVAGLCHTPMTKESARAMNEQIRSIEHQFDMILLRLDAAKEEDGDEIKSHYKVITERGEESPL